MNFLEVMKALLQQSGFAALTIQNVIMFIVSFLLLYCAIAKKFEPLLLLPIAFGVMLANLPSAGLMYEGSNIYEHGVLRVIQIGIKTNVFPCLIFMGVGAMIQHLHLQSQPDYSPGLKERQLELSEERMVLHQSSLQMLWHHI